MEALWNDARVTVRRLLRAPGFAAAVVLTMALGIGANTAIFSAVYGILLRPLGVPEPDRLMMIYQSPKANTDVLSGASPAVFQEWREQPRVFEGVAAFVGDSMTLEGEGAVEELNSTLLVTPDFFSVLGIEARVGRTFLPQDRVPGQRSQVAVLGHELWQRRWGGKAEVLGKTILLDGQSFEVVGVMPANVDVPQTAVDLWIPQEFRPGDPKYRRRLIAVGRLQEGVDLAQARAELATVSARLEETLPAARGWQANLLPVSEQLVGTVGPALLVAFAAVGFVLLIACMNVATLLLARAVERQREMATRRALGASQGQVFRQVLTESVLLSLISGAVGILLALLSHRLLISLAEGILPRVRDVQVDGPVLAFAALVSVLTGILFGLAPALYAQGVNLVESLNEGAKGSSGGKRSVVTRTLLVGSQVAMALVLLAGAGLLLRSLQDLRSVELGYEPSGAVAARIYLDTKSYPDDDAERLYFNRLLEKVRTLPGVEDAGAVSGLPLDPAGIRLVLPFAAESHAGLRPDQLPQADFRVATPGYFQAAGLTLVAGRPIEDRDRAGSPRIVVVNETLAQQIWPGESPLGKRITVYFRDSDQYEVVGVIGDVRSRGLALSPPAEMYVAHAQIPFSGMTVVARSAARPTDLIATLRREVLSLDPRQPPQSVVEVQQILAESLGRERFYTALLVTLAGAALILVAAGLYGVISHSVTQRTYEIGVRMALGARPRSVLGLVGQRIVAALLAGTLVGLVGVWATTRYLTSLLHEVSPTDPWVLAAVCGILALVAGLACLPPAWRACRLNPVEALRSQ